MGGVIYILTNPSFPSYVKIGYADNVEERLKKLNMSECIPFAFRIYATYEVDNRLVDLKLHNLIDQLNPTLRSVESFDGKQRKREFYAMTKEEAFSILEAIAEIHGYSDRLKIWKMNKEDQEAEEIANTVEIERKERASNFTFSEAKIPVGAVLEYVDDPNITCSVVDDRHISYNGEIMYLTTLVKMITGKKNGIAGPRYFKYKNASLWDIDNRIEK